MSEQPITREYTNGEVTVLWRAPICTHCGNCISELPHVFDMTKRPWVNMQGASSARIVEQVGRCPSGALEIQ